MALKSQPWTELTVTDAAGAGPEGLADASEGTTSS